MRGSPSCVIAVRRFALWRGIVVAVTLLSLATLVAWIVLAPAAHFIVSRIAVALVGLAVLALAASLLRTPPVELRWDGPAWSHCDIAAPLSAPTSSKSPSTWARSCCFDSLRPAFGVDEPFTGFRSSGAASNANGTRFAVLYIRRGPPTNRPAPRPPHTPE